MAFNSAGVHDTARTLKDDVTRRSKTGDVLAYTSGPRTDETCRELLALLTPFNIGMLTTEDWGSYARELTKDSHLTGKSFAYPIERNNLTARTRIKSLTLKPKHVVIATHIFSKL